MAKRITVPDGMLRAAWHAQLPADNPTFEWDEGDEISRKFYRRIFEAALLWLSENPIEPTEVQQREIAVKMAQYQNARMGKFEPSNYHIWFPAVEWQRRCFLASEPEVPTEIKDLLWSCDLRAHDVGIFGTVGVNVNDTIIEAFHRGQKSAVE